MNKEQLRKMYMNSIPSQIIKGEQLSYADWLEKLITEEYEINISQPKKYICMYCEKKMNPTEAIILCKECTENFDILNLERKLLLDFLNWFDQPIRLIDHEELIDLYIKDK
jgi:Zn finger protein HypA/HybF involved in hydrogenase expression